MLASFFIDMQKCHMLRENLVSNIISDDDVFFKWSMLAANWFQSNADVLLKMIAEEWNTLRGFSCTSAWMEKHKQSTCISLQKSKGTHRKLAVSNSNDKKIATCSANENAATCSTTLTNENAIKTKKNYYSSVFDKGNSKIQIKKD